MIITRTPHRLSLAGGGTDHPAWYRDHPGACLGLAVKLYCYVQLRALPPYFPEYRHRFSWSQIELLNDYRDSHHPALAAILADQCVEEGLEIHHSADVPSRAGLGSSSAFVVGVLHALRAHRGRYEVVPTYAFREDLAREAIRLERDVMREVVGDQDQYLCALGGLNRLEFTPDGAIAQGVAATPDRVAHVLEHLTLFYTGLQRTAQELETKKIAAIPTHQRGLAQLYNLVDEAESIVVAGDPRRLGEIFDIAWDIKRSLDPSVTNAEIEQIYKTAIRAGATGGRLVGAGGGGFFLFCRSPENGPRLSAALSGYIEVRPQLDTEGTKVVVNGF